MRRFHFESRLRLPHPPERVFPFFADPRNLEVITPPFLRFRVVSSTDEKLRAGSEIEYRLQLRGLPLRWRSRISQWTPPHLFADEQLRGPYRLWVHRHTFEPDGDGTIVGDRVEYAVHGGWLVDRLLVRRDVERIFAYRRERLLELLGGATVPDAAAVARAS